MFIQMQHHIQVDVPNQCVKCTVSISLPVIQSACVYVCAHVCMNLFVQCTDPHTASNYAPSKETMRQFNLL